MQLLSTEAVSATHFSVLAEQTDTLSSVPTPQKWDMVVHAITTTLRKQGQEDLESQVIPGYPASSAVLEYIRPSAQ